MSSILDILTRVGYEARDFGKSYRMKPLYRDSNNNTSLIVDKDTGKWHDFSTNQAGELKDLIKLTLNLKDEDASKFLGDHTFVTQAPTVKLDQQKTYDKSLLIKLRKDYSYWEGRGISARTLETLGGGVADNGKMAHRYVFPIFNERGEIVGFAGRDVTGKSPIKWKLLSKKSEWVFPIQSHEHIQSSRSAIIVESIGDAISLWEMGVKNLLVTFGLTLSSTQIAFLIKNDVQKINILLNNDSGNGLSGNIAADKIQQKLRNFFDDGQIRVILPPKNDINEMLTSDPKELKDFLSANGL